MKNLTIKKQVLLLSGLLLGVQVILALVGFLSLESINEKLNLVFSKRLPSINYLVQADRDFQQMLVAERSLLLKGLSQERQVGFQKDYHANKAQVAERFDSYKKLASSEEEKKIISDFEQRFSSWKKISDNGFLFDEQKNLRLTEENRDALTQKSFGDSYTQFENSRDQLDKLQELILAKGNTEFLDAQETYNNGFRLIVGLSITGIIASFILGYLISHSINSRITKIARTMEEEGDTLDSISNQLDSRSNDMKVVSSDLSAAATETTSSLHEITQMIKNNTEGANRVSNLIDQSKNHLNDGVRFLEDLTARINQVENSSTELSETIQQSNDELTEILKVFHEVNNKTKVINDIVFQTKLLSFNASVEAARAGENGKGFAVVAEEVGNLARMSGESADEISSLLEQSLTRVTNIVENSKTKVTSSISENQKYVRESVELSGECKKLILSVSHDFSEVAETSNQVSHASKEQLTGVEEVNQAMQNISNAAGSSNDCALVVNDSSQEVRRSVYQISQNILALSALVGQINESKENLKPLKGKISQIDKDQEEPYSKAA